MIDPWKDIPHSMVMGGMFHAALTDAEGNEWSEYVTTQTTWREYIIAKAQFDAAASTNIPLDETERRVRELLRTQQAVFNLAQAWYGRILARRSEPEKGNDETETDKDHRDG